MRVAYFDLGFSKESYCLNPKRYGGGGVLARYMKEDPDIQFEVFAPREAFENVGPTERKDRCHALPEQATAMLSQGFPVSHICSDSTTFDRFDLILHGHTCFALNRGSYKGPLVHWSGFDGKAGHLGNDYVLLYDPSFRPQFGERAKYVRIGKPVPAQCPEKPTHVTETPYVLQVSRHDDHMASINLAKACLEAGIKGVFAGPIHGDYPLRDYIDGKTTFYLGEISEQEKLDLHRRARLVALLLEWDAPFNQTIIEAQGQGTPIYVNQRGPFLQTYLKDGVNGFDAATITLRQAFDRALLVNAFDCHAAAREYDVSVMCRTFKQAFTEIVAEWRAEHPSL